MSKEDDLRDALNAAAQQISSHDNNPRAWQSWMVYLLERLEQKSVDENPSHQASFREMLSALDDVIRNRLKTGGW
jgi:hypothetical protein